jgi:SAM-dependent methyltransferase
MPFSLNLPYPICYPMTRLARRLSPMWLPKIAEDQEAYFEGQSQTTERAVREFMAGIEFRDRVVFDVGSGLGGRAPYWLDLGARHVYCVDINRQELAAGREIMAAHRPGHARRVTFVHPDEVPPGAAGDLAILFDCFEHLTDPAAVLRACDRWLRPGGEVWIGSIGWYHYKAAHISYMIPIPWCQVLFSERALIRTIRRIMRSDDYEATVWDRLEGLDRWDGVRSLRDRPGEPLNLLSLRAIRRVLRESPFQVTRFRVHGFGRRTSALARLLAPAARIPGLNELLHSYYTAVLRKSGEAGRA